MLCLILSGGWLVVTVLVQAKEGELAAAKRALDIADIAQNAATPPNGGAMQEDVEMAQAELALIKQELQAAQVHIQCILLLVQWG